MIGTSSKRRFAGCTESRIYNYMCLPRACLDIGQGASDANETVKAYSNRMQSMWREAGWNAGSTDVQRVLYEIVWAGLRPGMQARIKPSVRENGRFASIYELFKTAQDVEIWSNRDKRAGTTQNQPPTPAEKWNGYNGGNNGGNNGGKDKKKRPYYDAQSSTPSRNYSHDYSHNYDHWNLPPAPWADRETRDERRENELCNGCGGANETLLCPKYSRADIPLTRKYDDPHDPHDPQDRQDCD
jgi:hypothetical protein